MIVIDATIWSITLDIAGSVNYNCNMFIIHATGESIEIGLEQALFFNFFSAFEHVKSLLIMGPNNTKNSSLKCDFHIINYE